MVLFVWRCDSGWGPLQPPPRTATEEAHRKPHADTEAVTEQRGAQHRRNKSTTTRRIALLLILVLGRSSARHGSSFIRSCEQQSHGRFINFLIFNPALFDCSPSFVEGEVSVSGVGQRWKSLAWFDSLHVRSLYKTGRHLQNITESFQRAQLRGAERVAVFSRARRFCEEMSAADELVCKTVRRFSIFLCEIQLKNGSLFFFVEMRRVESKQKAFGADQ